MITSLTPAQTEEMLAVRDRWIQHGLCTDPADWEEAEAAVKELYASAKLPQPKTIIRAASPIVGALAAPLAAVFISLHRNGIGAAGAPTIKDSLNEAWAVESAVGSAVESAVRSAVRSAVESAVRSAVESAVESAVGSAV